MTSYKKTKQRPSLAICIPVWNRGHLFRIGFASLLRNLKGVDATIWIFDNGSDKKTRKVVEAVESVEHRIHKVFFPENMGIPYAVNIFAQVIHENCDYSNYRSPQYVMLMDSDAYFKKPIKDLVRLCRDIYAIGVLSGHDSIEHETVREWGVKSGGKKFTLKEKKNERMLTMLMKKEEFSRCYPFPHYRNRDVDWEIAQWNPNSMKKRGKKILIAPCYVLHLGIKASTWNTSKKILESQQEIQEVKKILKKNKL